MMHKIQTVLVLLLALAAASCSEVESIGPGGEDGKAPISFSMSDDAERATRAGFHGGATFIAMRIQSDNTKGSGTLFTRTTATADKDATNSTTSYSMVTFGNDEKRYWDDAHGQYSKLSVYAVAIPNAVTDVAGLTSKLPDGGTSALGKWGSDGTNTIAWTVTTDAQTKDEADYNKAPVTSGSGTIDREDLVYSNNIREGGKDGVYRWNFTYKKYMPDDTGDTKHENGQMMFVWENYDPSNPTTSPSATVGKFDKGHLVFRHALSRITVTLKAGTGFAADAFTFSAGTTIRLLNMPKSGTLDLPMGTWSGVSRGDISNMALAKGTPGSAAGTFMGQMLPGYVIANGDRTNVMDFTIDGNTYYVTQDMLFDALNKDGNRQADYGYDASGGGRFTMMQGTNYQFTFTINKRKVESITASLVPWESVTADPQDLTNARIKLLLEERGTEQTKDVAFYKANDKKTTAGIDDDYTSYQWAKGYNKLNATYSSDHWTTTDTYWETSRDFYHFRALMPATTPIATADGEDYFSLSSSCSDTESYNEVAWGAPMVDDGDNETPGTFTWDYDPTTYGFDGKHVADDPSKHQINKAIGATENTIKLTLFHMMSGVHFKLNTPDAADKVRLYDGPKRTRVELVGYYPKGKVLLGTGFVKPDGTLSTVAAPQTVDCATTAAGDYGPQDYFFSAVPQSLTAVKLYITTPDDNRYIVDLADVKASSVSSNNLANPYSPGSDGKYKIDRWYPGFKYAYTLTLRKTAVNTTVSLTDWEKVEASNDVWF